jgi:predicted enzyme involved in methoxymalonyl-ACP biosynthesis
MIEFKQLKRNLKKDASALPSIKVALIGDTATQFLATGIRGMGYERGYNIILFEAEYNQVERQFLDPSSELYSFDADFIIVFQSTHKLLEKHSLLSGDKQLTLADDRLEFIAAICENPTLKDKKIIYFNYPEIEDTVFGSYANKVSSSFSYQVRKLNYELMNLAQQHANLFICDIAGLQISLGGISCSHLMSISVQRWYSLSTLFPMCHHA